MLLSKALKV
jgi:hypothetical protein